MSQRAKAAQRHGDTLNIWWKFIYSRTSMSSDLRQNSFNWYILKIKAPFTEVKVGQYTLNWCLLEHVNNEIYQSFNNLRFNTYSILFYTYCKFVFMLSGIIYNGNSISNTAMQ